MNTARFIKVVEGPGEKALYELNPPTNRSLDRGSARFVVVSAVNAPYSGAETYIFAADEYGNVIDWSELEGSYRGGYSHAHALEGAGYTVVKD